MVYHPRPRRIAASVCFDASRRSHLFSAAHSQSLHGHCASRQPDHCWLPLAAGFAAPAHRGGRQRKQRVSPALYKREFSLESLQQSVAFVAGLVRRARLCWCRCCRSGPPCAALLATVCRFGKPPLPRWARRCRVDGAAALRALPLSLCAGAGGPGAVSAPPRHLLPLSVDRPPVAATCAGASGAGFRCGTSGGGGCFRRAVEFAVRARRCRGGGAAVRWSWRPRAAERRRRSWWPVSFCTAVWTRCRFPWSHSPASCAGTGGPPRRAPSPTGPPPAESASARTTGRCGWCLCAGASGRRGPCIGRGGRGAGCRRAERAGNPFAFVLRSARPRRGRPARLPGRPETSPTAFQTVRAVSPPRPTAIGKTSSPA
jgi:hypothetical protein